MISPSAVPFSYVRTLPDDNNYSPTLSPGVCFRDAVPISFAPLLHHRVRHSEYASGIHFFNRPVDQVSDCGSSTEDRWQREHGRGCAAIGGWQARFLRDMDDWGT